VNEATQATELPARIAEAIRSFPFDNYGLDDVSYLLEAEADAQEWVSALAAVILPLVRSLETEVAAARKYAAEMRDFCSPHGVSVHYADPLVEAMDRAKGGQA
jgi:4-aminobutyrate aminotransferase-like enzyme